MHANKQQQQIEMKKILRPIIIFDPGTQFPGNEKITLCNYYYYYYYYYYYTPGNIDPRG